MGVLSGPANGLSVCARNELNGVSLPQQRKMARSPLPMHEASETVPVKANKPSASASGGKDHPPFPLRILNVLDLCENHFVLLSKEEMRSNYLWLL
jgi:hypothetical protein